MIAGLMLKLCSSTSVPGGLTPEESEGRTWQERARKSKKDRSCGRGCGRVSMCLC